LQTKWHARIYRLIDLQIIIIIIIIISLSHQKVTVIADRSDGILFDGREDGVGEIVQDDVQDASVRQLGTQQLVWVSMRRMR
jgi:hypothetical protein